MRALPRSGAAAYRTGDTTLYRADLTVRFRPLSRVSATVGAGLTRDETSTGRLAHRDFSERHAGAPLTVGLPADLA